MKSQLTKDAIALQIALKKLVRIYQFRDRDKILSFTSGLSVNQFYIIELIINDKSIGIIDLTKKLFLNKSTISRIVDQLVEQGFIIKENSTYDGRSIILKSTEKSLKAYNQITNFEIASFEDQLRQEEPDVRDAITRLINRIAKDAETAFLN